jgi:hypothetical protein
MLELPVLGSGGPFANPTRVSQPAATLEAEPLVVGSSKSVSTQGRGEDQVRDCGLSLV